MKKMILSASAFAVVAFSGAAVAPTTAEAIPAFARQTGSACLACHHNSFPALNSYGRAFKQGALTSVGEQTLVEDDMLSITSTVNMTVVLRPQFVSTTVATAAGSTTTKTASIPADQVVLIAGRVGTNTGTFIEIGFGGGAVSGTGTAATVAQGGFANFQLFNSWDLGGVQAGFTIFNSGFGETAGMEVGSTYGQHGGLLAGKNLSASETLSANTGGTGGVALFAANDMVTASVSFITDSRALGGAGNGWKLAPSARVFGTFDLGGLEAGLGFNLTSGSTGNAQTVSALGLAAGTVLKMKKWAIDGQLQGEVGDMGLGIYADYASAAAPSAGELNLFNPNSAVGQGALKGYSVRFDLKPIHTVVVGAGLGRMKDSLTKTSQFQVAAEYEIYQNFVVALIYNNTKATASTGAVTTTKKTTLDIEALL